jgi:hypothetical protein
VLNLGFFCKAAIFIWGGKGPHEVKIDRGEGFLGAAAIQKKLKPLGRLTEGDL